MPEKEKYNDNTVAMLRKVVVLTGFYVTMAGGLLASIVIIYKTQNYIHPYLFRFTWGIIGFLAGLYISRILKPYVILNPIILSNYRNLSMIFSLGFIGVVMSLGYFLNTGLSTLVKCDNFAIVDTKFRKSAFKQPGLSVLIVNIDGTNQKLHCSHRYFEESRIRGLTNICIYKSPIGFDYLRVTNDE